MKFKVPYYNPLYDMSSRLSNLLSAIGPLITNQALATLALFLFLHSAGLVRISEAPDVLSTCSCLFMWQTPTHVFTSPLKFHIFFAHLVHYWSPINNHFFLTQSVLAKQKRIEGHNYNLKPRKPKERQTYFENWMYTKAVYLQNCEEFSKKKVTIKNDF